ncbi:C2 domain-containing protein [Artemisia annua]|uniref:C2 domain-containing protein n=1 Tax=Artemisia annua TaxID=35608 RepID=A0A2U1LI63_ARTAN|nr:C2 domain-containing protein [Artemisia annua]
MECRNLELILLSADGLKKPNSIKKADKVYADVSILGTDNKLRTPVNQTGGSEPTWNHRMKFTMDEDLAQQNRLTLVVKIKAVRIFTHKNLGEVCVPIKELMEGIKDEGKDMQFVTYQVKQESKLRNLKGLSNFGINFVKSLKSRLL